MARAGKNVEDHNVVKMRRRSQPGIAFFLTLLILLYLIILAWNYFTKSHVSIYEVNTSEISDDSPRFAYVVREEEVVTTDDAGYINYYISEGSRVGKGNVVYTLDDNDSLRKMLGNIRNDNVGVTEISPIREQIDTFNNSFDLSNYQEVSDFHFSINNIILEHSRGNLYKTMKKQIKKTGTTAEYRKYKAPKSGVISYYTDGLEDIRSSKVTPKLLASNGNVERKQVAATGHVMSGEAAYKLVTSNDWSLVTELDDSYYESLKDMDSVRITVLRDGVSFNASIRHFERGGKHLCELSTSRFMERYINDRFLRIEFNLRHASGLKIPNSSILKKEYYEVPQNFITVNNGKQTIVKQTVDPDNGSGVENIDITSSFTDEDKTYIRDQRLSAGDTLLSGKGGLFTLNKKMDRDGVYSVNEGFCRFRPINILYQNKEYSIIADDTKDGLKSFDHIVVDPTELTDNDFID